MTRPFGVLREAALWIAALIGTICLIAAIAAVTLGVTPLIFRSGSMEPGIPTGSLAIAVSTPASELRPGDIVSVVWASDTRVTHRLVSSTPFGSDLYTLTTQGDANTTADTEAVTVARADRVVWSVPGLGYVLQEVSKPQWVFALGVGVGALLLLVFRGSTREPALVTSKPARAAAANPRHGRGRSRHRAGAAVAGVGVITVGALVVSLLTTAPTGTLAAYQNTATTAGTFATGSLPAPTITGCTINNSLGVFQSVTVTWTMPAGYLKANADVGMGTTVGGITPVTPPPTIGGTNPGPFTFTYSSSLLGTILSSLFGSTAYIGVRTTSGTWNSAWTTRKLSIGVAGLSSTCTIS